MNLFPAIFSPVLLLFSATGAGTDAPALPAGDAAVATHLTPDAEARTESLDWVVNALERNSAPVDRASMSFEPGEAWQMRVQQRVIIRITPRAQMPVRPQMLADMPGGAVSSNFVERRIGNCLSPESIAGVQPMGSQSLVLYLRDRRMVSAELERGCRSRDFYSGFYVSRSEDGKLCVDRDRLQSRNGASCRLTRIRQMVPVGN